MEWNVFCYNINKGKIETFNIFDHWKITEDVQKSLKKFKDKNEFKKEIESYLMYYFWSKSQYELIIEITESNRIFLIPWCGCREPEKAKIDVTDDASFDWRRFAEKHIDKQVYKNKKKIDVYDQVMFNFEAFVDYVWSNKNYG